MNQDGLVRGNRSRLVLSLERIISLTDKVSVVDLYIKSIFSHCRKGISLFVLFLGGFVFVQSSIGASMPAVAVIPFVQSSDLAEDGKASGKIELHISNISNSEISKVRIEPLDPANKIIGLPPVQIPLLGIAEKKVSFIEVQSLRINETSIPHWKLTYFVGDIKHEELLFSDFVL